MAAALSGGGITSKVDVTYLNFFLKEFNAVRLGRRDIGVWLIVPEYCDAGPYFIVPACMRQPTISALFL